jgi:phage tail sheath protein FI
LWRQGALMGSKPNEAYQVRIGLGKSMTEEDVLQGILRIDIALAPVRPAEFIVMSFFHHVTPA